MSLIVTHTSPDFDAILSVYLLVTYGGLGDSDTVFLNTGDPDPIILRMATAVVDTGGVYDPEALRFDHHQLPLEEAESTCAAKQVWKYLVAKGAPVLHLTKLVDLVHAGDIGSKEYGAGFSRELGIHAMLSALKASSGESEKLTDDDLYHIASEWLTLLDHRLWLHQQAQEAFKQSAVWQSDDGLVVALLDAPEQSSSVAFENGAKIVVFQNTYELLNGTTTNAIGVWRPSEQKKIHLGTLVERAIEYCELWADFDGKHFFTFDLVAMKEELQSWYRHKGQFYAGRGNKKAPDSRPITVDVRDVAKLINYVWE